MAIKPSLDSVFKDLRITDTGKLLYAALASCIPKEHIYIVKLDSDKRGTEDIILLTFKPSAPNLPYHYFVYELAPYKVNIDSALFDTQLLDYDFLNVLGMLHNNKGLNVLVWDGGLPYPINNYIERVAERVKE